jgi:hypothetical protein
MKDESLIILEPELVAETSAHRLGVTKGTAALAHVNVSIEHAANRQHSAARFLKSALSNFFLLGCLLGLFGLYCCSCVIHALSFPARRKTS